MTTGWIGRARTAAVILAAVVGLAPAAGAQGTQEVEDALRRTDELLRQAQEIVQNSDSQHARMLLEQALTAQRNAWTKYQDRQPRLALSLTIEARDLAKRAIRLAREDSSLRQRAQRELERAWDALQRAREELAGAPDEVLRVLHEAHQQVERGRQQFAEQNYEPAVRLAISAQRLVRQALGSSDSAGGAERLHRELERTDRLIERAREAVSGVDLAEAVRALERATNLQHDAWAQFRAERFRAALAATKEARKLAARVLAIVQGPVSSERVGRAIAETDRLLDRAAEIVGEATDDAAVRLVERAREHQTEAKQLHAEGQLRAAHAKTRVAAGLAKRAMRLVEGGSEL